jgi:hypothetical protein
MSETATADATYYSHTLTHRPHSPTMESSRDRDTRLTAITSKLLSLPLEIRSHIYALTFSGNRVAVTCHSGCYCASMTTGRYRAEHRWLLHLTSGAVRLDAQRGFVSQAWWEIHCPSAWEVFVQRLRVAGAERWVRHVRTNVFETSPEPWVVRTGDLAGLRSVTFCPWQKGWSCDVPALQGSLELSDEMMMPKVKEMLRTKAGYEWVWEMVKLGREERGGWKVHFLFPIRYLHEVTRDRKRWQLRVSHFCFSYIELLTPADRSGVQIWMTI